MEKIDNLIKQIDSGNVDAPECKHLLAELRDAFKSEKDINFSDMAEANEVLCGVFSSHPQLFDDVVETLMAEVQNENFDKLIMDVYTNGSITPEEAMALSSKILNCSPLLTQSILL